jgi:3-dehydroshikimate dehydratase
VADRLRAGLCSVTLRARPADEVVRIAARAGLEAIEWGADTHVRPGDLARAAALARRCADVGLTCASYGSYLFAPAAAPVAVAAVLDTAAALGAPNVRIWTAMGGPDPAPDERAAIGEHVGATAAAAALQGLTVSLEFHPGTLTDTASSTVALLDEVAAPNLFTYWQPPTGLAPADLLESWRGVRTRASHLHVFRWRSYDDRLPLAEGDDIWPAVFAEPATDDRWPGDRCAFLEFVRGDDPDQVVADAAVLRSWLAAR